MRPSARLHLRPPSSRHPVLTDPSPFMPPRAKPISKAVLASSEHVEAPEPPTTTEASARSSRQTDKRDYRLMDSGRAPNRSHEEVVAEKVEKEKVLEEEVRRRAGAIADFAEFEVQAANDHVQKRTRATRRASPKDSAPTSNKQTRPLVPASNQNGGLSSTEPRTSTRPAVRVFDQFTMLDL